MKLEYFDLLSPEPIYIIGIGSIKSPKLRDICKLGYLSYKNYINVLLLNPEDYYNNFEKDKIQWYKSLDEESKNKIYMYDLMLSNEQLITMYVEVFDFFFNEIVTFNVNKGIFCLFSNDESVNNESKAIGNINRDTFSDICDIILQRINIFRDYSNEDFKKVKNKRALEILKKLKKGQEQQNKNNQQNKKIELPNIISALSTYHNSLNINNIWDITIFQLYDQFNRQQNKIVFNINSNSVSVWGDKENKFNITKWFETMDK